MILKTIFCFGLFSFGCLADNEKNDYDIYSDKNEYDKRTSDIERPCRSFDMFCIRQYFVKHGKCREALGPVPNPLYRDQLNIFLPKVNMSITSLKIEYTGIYRGIVEEFYINKKTDTLLLAVEFKDITFGSNENYFRFHRKGKEPIETMTFFNVTKASFVTTIIIPNLSDLQIQDGEVFTYNNDPTRGLVVGPTAFISSDPTTLETLAEFLVSIPTLLQEAMLTESTFLIGSFIKYNICDFGYQIL